MSPFLPKEDDYSPAVSSPLNPTSCYQIQTKQHHRHKRGIRIVGKTAAKLSPTECLLRHKGALAAAAARQNGLGGGGGGLKSSSRSKPERYRRNGRSNGSGGDDDGDIAMSGMLRRGSEFSGGANAGSMGMDAAALELRDYATAAAAAAAGQQQGPTCSRPRSSSSSSSSLLGDGGGADVEDEKHSSSSSQMMDDGGGNSGSEYLVELSGVTIESITTVVLMPQQRAMFASLTPSRVLWILTIFSILIILIFLRLQALFDKYLRP